MNTPIRNFWNVIRRFKMATFLNVTGLSVAFAAFLVIMMQVEYEQTFDHCYPASDRIYRVDRVRDASGDAFAPIVPRAFADAVFASSPHVKAATMITIWGSNTYLTVGEGNDRKGFKEPVVTCYPDIVSVFGFALVDGTPDCLKDPEKMLIPESLARRMFGNEQAVGKQIRLEDKVWMKGDMMNFTVGAVYKDLPANAQLENFIYTAMDKTGEGDWCSQNSLAYIRLDSPESEKTVEENFNKTFDLKQFGCGSPEGTHLELIPMEDIYYLPNQMPDFTKTGDPSTVKLLFLIALLVVAVACINFTNFSTSLAPMRIKSINTQKVLGGSTSGLRAALVFEAVGICFLSCLIAFGLVWFLNYTQVLSFVEADTALANHIPLLGVMIGIAVLVGLIAGVYPAWYMTSYPPALVLKGSFGLSPSGRKLRTALVGFQYVVSIGLIVGASFIQLQNNYMRSFNLGFDKEQIAIVELSSKICSDHKEAYVSKMKAYAGIEDVAFASTVVGGSDSYSMGPRSYNNEEFYTWIVNVSWNFLDVMGMPVVDGRNFMQADVSRDSVEYSIYTLPVKERMKMVAGDYLGNQKNRKLQVLGFVDDVKMLSLRNSFYRMEDISFTLTSWPMKVSYIRLKAGANVEETVSHIRRVMTEIDPSYPFDIKFYDAIYNNLYHKEQYLKRMITLFSILAIIISIVGVFGMVVFETQYRRKEIGLRKVHGATVKEILLMFNKRYIQIVMICFVIATPIAWYGVNKWLEGFVYRTPVYWWIFAFALLLVAAITAVTVTFQNWRAANENPVNSIKSE